MTDLHTAATAFNDADLNWHHALVDAFGNDAGQARYEPRGKGEEGTALRAAYEAREAARTAWEAAKSPYPIGLLIEALPYVEAAQDDEAHDAGGKARARALAAKIRAAVK